MFKDNQSQVINPALKYRRSRLGGNDGAREINSLVNKDKDRRCRI